MATARRILERGDGVMIFPEGTRVRPGPLGHPRRGVGRLALETGAVVVPVAVIGSAEVRRGWRIRPQQGPRALRAAPLRFPKVERPSRGARQGRHRPHLAVRRAAVGVARRHAAAAPRRRHRRRLVGHEPRDRARARRRRRSSSAAAPRSRRASSAPSARTAATCPASRCRTRSASRAPATLELREADLVCLAVPTRDLPVAMGEIGDRLGAAHEPARLVQGPRPAGRRAARPPSAPAAPAAAPSPASAARRTPPTRSSTARRSSLACDRPRAARAAAAPAAPTPASTSRRRATSSASSSPASPRTPRCSPPTTASVGGPNASGAAAGKVFSEIAAYAGALGARPETWTGPRRRRRPRRLGRRRRRAQPPRRRAARARRLRSRRSAPRSARSPRRSTRCRCS